MSENVLSGFKACCVDLYGNPAVTWLMGDSFHPGGSAVTERLGRLASLKPSDLVLDVACGTGSSATLLAKQFGCRVVGADLAGSLVFRARAAAGRKKLDRLLDFALGDAEALPFQDASFDAVFSECAVSTFPDKDAAASEMARVLKPGGRLGFTDVVLDRKEVAGDPLGWFFQVACISDACSTGRYREIFASAGFSGWQEQLHPEALTLLLNQVRARLLTLEVAKGLQKVDLTGFDLTPARQILRRVEDWIKSGGVTYGIFLAVKEAPHE